MALARQTMNRWCIEGNALTLGDTNFIWRVMNGFLVTSTVSKRRRRRTCDTARAHICE
jgi:hypothetical protein